MAEEENEKITVFIPNKRFVEVTVPKSAKVRLEHDEMKAAFTDMMEFHDAKTVKGNRQEDTNATLALLELAKKSGLNYPDYRDHYRAIVKHTGAIHEAVTFTLGIVSFWGQLSEKTRAQTDYKNFISLTSGNMLNPEEFDRLMKAGLSKKIQLDAADAALRNGVPLDFIENCAAKGMKFGNADELARTHSWNGHFDLDFIKNHKKEFLGLPRERISQAEEIGGTVLYPDTKLELLKMGAAPDDVKKLAKSFEHKKLPELLSLATGHGATADDLLHLKSEGVQEQHFREVLGALQEIGDTEKETRLEKAVANYKLGLRQRPELALAHHLHGQVDPQAMQKIVGFGLEHGIKDIELLKFLHSASKATRESHANVLSTLTAMSRDKPQSARQLGVASDLTKWDERRTLEMAARMKSRSRRE